MSEEEIENINVSERNFAPNFVDHHLLPDINFNGHCLIKNNISMLKEIINLDISYNLNPQLRNLNIDFTLNNCLFGSVKLTTNADLDKYRYGYYGIGFDSRSEFLSTDGSFGENAITFRAGMSSFVHFDNKNRDIFILCEGTTQGLYDTILTGDAKYPFNFTEFGKRFILSLQYNESNSFLFIKATTIYQFKAKYSEIKDYVLCLGNISKDITINNMRENKD